MTTLPLSRATTAQPGPGAVERRIVTVLFVDLVGFTTLSDQLDCEDVASVQRSYFESLADAVARHGGIVEKYIGDAVMAVFGLDRTREDDAVRAVRAAFAIVSAVEQLSARVGLEPGTLHVRAGVNTGEVVVGSGEGALVTGDVVNVTARLQSAAPVAGVLVSESTALAVAHAIALGPIEPHVLKGKPEPVLAAIATGVLPQRSREAAMGALRSPLVGRDAELTALRTALLDGGRITVLGAAGVGKTRLTEEFAATCETPVLRARVRAEDLTPYSAIAQLVTAAGFPDATTLTARLVAAGASTRRADVVSEALRALLDGGTSNRLPAAADGRALFEMWLEGLSALADGQRVVWLVDDVHWASADTLAFLDLAGRSGARLVVASARPALLERAPDWPTNVLELQPLPVVDAAELVRRLVGDALGSDVVDLIATRSAGNPLFIEELLRSWVSTGVLVQRGGSWLLDAPDVSVVMPQTVQAVYAAQIDDLPDSERAVTRRASVAGRQFPDGVVATFGIAFADEAMQTLERAALLAGAAADPVLGPTHAYRHALLRDAAYATLSRAERASLHLNVATWLEATAADRVDEVAERIADHHLAALAAAPALAADFDRAAVLSTAVGWLDRAAEQALRLAAYETARALARKSLEFAPDAPLLDRARRFELLGRATAYVADMDAGAEAAGRALELYRRAGDRGGLGRAGLALGLILIEQLRFDRAHALAEGLLAELGDPADGAVGQALVLRALAAATLTNSLEQCEADSARARAIAVETGDHDLERATVAHVAAFHVALPGSLDTFDRIRERAERDGDGVTVGAMREARGLVELVTDRAAAAVRSAAEARDIAAAYGVVESVGWADYLGAEALFISGDWDAALVAARSALALGFAHGYRRVVGRTMGPYAAIGAARRDPAILRELRDWFQVAREHFPPTPFGLMNTTGWDRWLAQAGFIAPRPPVAVPESWGIFGQCPSWYAVAEATFDSLLEVGRIDEAKAAVDAYACSPDGRLSACSRGFATLLRAKLDQDRTAAGDAVELFAAAAAPWLESKALRLAGRPDEAVGIERRLRIG